MRREIGRAATLLLWGALIVAVDLEIEGVDLLVDPVGMVLVVAGLTRLERVSSGPARRTFDVAIYPAAAGVLVTGAIALHRLAATPEPVALHILEGVITVLGPMMLASGMRHVAIQEPTARELRPTWERTFWLLLAFALAPTLGSWAWELFGDPVAVTTPSLTTVGILMVLVVVAFVHLLVSLVRTRRWAERESSPSSNQGAER